MNALIESVSSASSVGDDDHPDIRISPESAPMVPLGVVVPGVPPHAATRIAKSATTASTDLPFLIGIPPPRACGVIVLPGSQRALTASPLAWTSVRRAR